jgi:hypothetical protein
LVAEGVKAFLARLLYEDEEALLSPSCQERQDRTLELLRFFSWEPMAALGENMQL